MNITVDQQEDLIKTYWTLRELGQVIDAVKVGSILREAGICSSLKEKIDQYENNLEIAIELDRLIKAKQPFRIAYQSSKKSVSSYEVLWAEIVSEDKHRPQNLYLKCWVQEGWCGTEDLSALSHNKSFRLDRIKKINVISEASWREEGLDFLECEFDLSGGLPYGYEPDPDDISVQWVSGETSMVKRVKRNIHSLFWFKLNNAHLILSGDMKINTPGISRLVAKDLEKAISKIKRPENWVIYHARRGSRNDYLFPCPDGWASAFIAWKKLKDTATYIPLDYEMAIPFSPESGDKIYCLDFSVNTETINKWKSLGCEVIIIDHHESQVKHLMGLGGFELIVDYQRCGAWLTWDYFFPDVELPEWVRYIDYRDTGKAWNPEYESLLDYNEFFCGMRSQPFDFKVWDKETQSDPTQRWIELGKPLYQERLKKVAKTIKDKLEIRKIPGGAVVPVLKGASYPTESAAYLYEHYPEYDFYAFVSEVEGGEKWSLRSDVANGNFDCSAYAVEVTKFFDPEFEGGKGHPNAASFFLPCSESEFWSRYQQP